MSAGAPFPALRRLLREAPPRREGEACQRCGAELSPDHLHLADVESRGLLCVCARCHAAAGAAGDGAAETVRHRVVPRRYLMLPGDVIGEERWSALEIPVGIAFFFRNSALGRSVACYPSPAGAIESVLPAESWDAVLDASAATRTLAPDVEALLVRRTREVSQCFIVPIDTCYELAGRIRRRWSGFGGGPEARGEIDAFFDGLVARSERVPG